MIHELKTMSQKDMKVYDDMVCLKQELCDVKVMVKSLVEKPNRQSNVNNLEPAKSYRAALNATPGNFSSELTRRREGVNDDSDQSSGNSTSRNKKRLLSPIQSTGDESRVKRMKSNSYVDEVIVESVQVSNEIRPRNNSRRLKTNNNILGTGAPSTFLSGVPRVFDVFVGGCGSDSTADHIINYCQNNDTNVIKCVELPTKSEWYKSFKLSVESTTRERVLVANFWPPGIFVRKFFKARFARNIDSLP